MFGTFRAIRHGIFYVAFVLPENAFGTRSIKKYAENNENSEDRMIISFFDHPDLAGLVQEFACLNTIASAG